MEGTRYVLKQVATTDGWIYDVPDGSVYRHRLLAARVSLPESRRRTRKCLIKSPSSNHFLDYMGAQIAGSRVMRSAREWHIRAFPAGRPTAHPGLAAWLCWRHDQRSIRTQGHRGDGRPEPRHLESRTDRATAHRTRRPASDRPRALRRRKRTGCGPPTPPRREPEPRHSRRDQPLRSRPRAQIRTDPA
jgi:hypothetical protein